MSNAGIKKPNPGENFLHNFLRLPGGPSCAATVIFLAAVPLSDDGRRQTAAAARSAIAHALGYPDT